MVFTEEDLTKYFSEKGWHTCEGEFTQGDKNYIKVRGHCHYTEKCCRASHLICNLRFQENSFVPVMAHSASAYDNHLILREITKQIKNCVFLCVAEKCKNFGFFQFEKFLEK